MTMMKMIAVFLCVFAVLSVQALPSHHSGCRTVRYQSCVDVHILFIRIARLCNPKTRIECHSHRSSYDHQDEAMDLIDAEADAPKAAPEVEGFSSTFSDYDKDGNGQITPIEFGRATHMTKSSVAKTFKLLKLSKEGTLNCALFKKANSKLFMVGEPSC